MEADQSSRVEGTTLEVWLVAQLTAAARSRVKQSQLTAAAQSLGKQALGTAAAQALEILVQLTAEAQSVCR